MFISGIIVLALLTGCGADRTHPNLSYEAKVRRTELALREERVFEARNWVTEALKMKPQGREAERLLAKVIDREITLEKSPPQTPSPEELTAREKKLKIRTWLERSRGFTQVNQFDQALLAAEEVFRFDPGNPEASRLIDEIKEKSRAQGKEESLFLEDLYQKETETRVQRYQEQARTWLRTNQLGAARLAIEKILILDPKNAEGHRLLAKLDEKEKTV